jgi:hypothetical protein
MRKTELQRVQRTFAPGRIAFVVWAPNPQCGHCKLVEIGMAQSLSEFIMLKPCDLARLFMVPDIITNRWSHARV